MWIGICSTWAACDYNVQPRPSGTNNILGLQTLYLFIFSCLLSRLQSSFNDLAWPPAGEGELRATGESGGGGSVSSTGGILQSAACTSALESETEVYKIDFYINVKLLFYFKHSILDSIEYSS